MSWWPQFLGPSYRSAAPLADTETLRNFYLERVESPRAPTRYQLLPTPGFSPFLTTTDVGGRAWLSVSGRTFAVIGAGFYELFATASSTKWGTVAQDNNPATLTFNGIVPHQVFITSGGNGYLFDTSTNTFSTISALAGKATMGGMLNGFFLSFSVTNSTVYVSNENDGSTWTTASMFFEPDSPDPWKAMAVIPPLVYLLGEQTSKAWYNAGNSPQPFAPVVSSAMQFGTAASFGWTIAGGRLIWISRTGTGQGLVVVAQGYAPTPISNYGVETAIQTYARTSTIGDTELLTYQNQGHTFAVLNFPSANASWQVDLDTGDWSELGAWNSAQNRYDLWRPRIVGTAFGKQFAMDRSTGIVAQMDASFGTEVDGMPIRRQRVGPPLWASVYQPIILSRFQLQMTTGVGTSTGQGVNPQVMLRTSMNGQTWDSERLCGAGKIGQVNTPVFWMRLGAYRPCFVPEITVSDPVPWQIVGADLEGSGLAIGQAA